MNVPMIVVWIGGFFAVIGVAATAALVWLIATAKPPEGSLFEIDRRPPEACAEPDFGELRPARLLEQVQSFF